MDDTGKIVDERLEFLREQTDLNRVIKYVIRDEEGVIDYLPDLIEQLTRDTILNPEAGNEDPFTIIKAFLSSYTHVDVRDNVDSKIDLFDIVVLFLREGMKKEYEDSIEFGIYHHSDKKAKTEALIEVVQTYILPTKNEDDDAVTPFSYTPAIMVEAAINFDLSKRLKAQKKEVVAFTTFFNNYANLDDLDKYDDEIEEIKYRLMLQNNDGTTIKYSELFEQSLFDSIIVSERVRFVVLNGDECKIGKGVYQSVNTRWYKTFSKSNEDLVRYKSFGWLDDAQPYTVICYLYIGDDPTSQNVSSNDFVRLCYSYKKTDVGYGSFVVSLKSETIDVILKAMKGQIAGYQLFLPVSSDNHIVQIERSMIIPGLSLDYDLVMYKLFTDFTASTLLRVNENDKPWTLKKNLRFGVFLTGTSKAVVRSASVKKNVDIVKSQGILESILTGDKITIVTITADKMSDYNFIQSVILKFFKLYVNSYDEIYKFHSSFFNPKRERIEPMTKVGEKNGDLSVQKGIANIKLLKHADPSIWDNANYSRPLAPTPMLQVMAIKESEVKEYLLSGRDVILWPVEVNGLPADKQTKPSIDRKTGKPHRVFYTTSSQEMPHINLVENPGANKATHPYLPKCQKTKSNITINNVGPNADWKITYHVEDKNRATKEGLKSLKILEPERQGVVAGSLEKFLQSSSIIRLGMPLDPNSFLYAVMYALNIDNFRAQLKLPDATLAVEAVRPLLANFATACMQENVGKTVQQIAAELGDIEVFLDPLRHYRAVEEMFGVNIFVAIANDKKEMMITHPNYTGFYTRSKRREMGDSIVIARLIPQQSKTDKRPQCELIGGIDLQGVYGFRFNARITDALEGAVDMLTRTIDILPHCRVTQTDKGGYLAQSSMSVSFSNEDKITIARDIRLGILEQFVDEIGKVRGLKLKLKDGKSFWCVTPPLEPLSGFTSNDDGEEAVDQSFPLGNVVPCAYDLIQEITNQYQITDIKFTPCRNQLVGAWTLLHGINVFIPFVGVKWDSKFTPVRFDNPYTHFEGESPTQKHQRLKRVAIVYIQIAKRLFVASGLRSEVFLKQHVTLIEDPEVGAAMTTKNCTHLVPETSNFEELLDYFVVAFPTLFEQSTKRLICDSSRLLESLTKRIKVFEQIIDQEIYVTRTETRKNGNSAALTTFPPCLLEFYATQEDFRKTSQYQHIYLSKNEYNDILEYSSYSTPDVVKTITSTMTLKKLPIIYLYEDDEKQALFILQNVKTASLGVASYVALYWQQHQINLGYDVNFSISEQVVTVVDADNIKLTNVNGLIVVRYRTGEYAALLSLNHN